MNDVIVSVLILVVAVAGFSLWVIGENKTRQKLARKRFQESFGTVPQKEYTYEELDHISQLFYQKEKEGFYIDDITWNDLEMERIYVQLWEMRCFMIFCENRFLRSRNWKTGRALWNFLPAMKKNG